MHKFYFKQDCDVLDSVVTFNKNEWYIADNFNVGHMMKESSPYIIVEPYKNEKPFTKESKSIIFIRAGGWGDLLFTTPIIKKLKSLGVRIGFSTTNKSKCILENNPYIDEIIQYPLSLKKIEEYDSLAVFEDLLEYQGTTRHAIDVFADSIGIKVDDYKMLLYLRQEEKENALKRFPKNKKRIAVQLYASAAVRTYPRAHWLCLLLAKKGYEVFAFGQKGNLILEVTRGVVNHPNIVDVMNLEQSPSFRESCAILTTCDCVVAPDSSLTHVAGALDIPCVAIYGSFDWKLRTKYAPKTIALMGIAPCAPCFYHGRGSHIYPKGAACEKLGHCAALDSISEDRVIAKVESLIKESIE